MDSWYWYLILISNLESLVVFIKFKFMERKLLLTVSIIMNLVFTIHILYRNSTTWNPTWTSRAAIEAEDAASVSCSGHGRAYVDGIGVLGGKQPSCECNNCYTGKDCSILLSDCPVNANSYAKNPMIGSIVSTVWPN